jgi:putative membrane protein
MASFIDYSTLLLVNMTAGLTVLAVLVFRGLGRADPKAYVAPFAAAGLVALVCGLHMALAWPLPGSYNGPFGESSVLLGVLFLAAALSLAKGWRLHPLGIYAAVAGLAAIVIGARAFHLLTLPEPIQFTKLPALTGVGFILSGLGGALAVPALYLRRRVLAWVVALMLLAAAGIWAVTAYPAIWSHVEAFRDYQPGK